jgi:hypothetical protein
MAADEISRNIGLQSVKPHDVTLRVVQRHADKIHRHHPREAVSEFM